MSDKIERALMSEAHWCPAVSEVRELRAEVERLRATLEALTEYVAGEMGFTLQADGWHADDEKLASLVLAARDALEPHKPRYEDQT